MIAPPSAAYVPSVENDLMMSLHKQQAQQRAMPKRQASQPRSRRVEVLYEIAAQGEQIDLTQRTIKPYTLREVESAAARAASLIEIAARLKEATRASESLVDLSGMAGLLIVDGLRGGHEAASRAWIVEILRSEAAHKDHVEAVADALVNHLVPLWDEARAALKARLNAEDKYTFMSVLMPLLFDASSLDEGLETLRAQIPEERVALAQRLVKKIKQAGAPR